ncbi:MAG: CpXC domain-containing protein [Myxococcales bacterium]|nr:CpXC domain-containing protein [Myxococcales bacterium]
MSIQERHVIACPACQAELEGQLVDSLNARRHPHLREALLARRLHVFDCTVCGHALEVDKPLLYVDFDRFQFLGCVPGTERRHGRHHAEALVGAFDRAVRSGPAELAAQADRFLVRITFGYEELREKVAIDAAGLYDLAVEALKARLVAAEPWFQREEVVTLSFDGLEDDGRLRFYPTWLLARRASVGHTVWAQRRLYDDVFAEHETLLDQLPGLASGPHVSLLRLAFDTTAPSPQERPAS